MIRNMIEDRIGDLKGNIGISYVDLNTGISCFTGNCDVFPSSGMVKLFLLIEIFHQLDSGKLHKEQIHALTSEDCSFFRKSELDEPSYGVISFLHEGLELNIRDLVYLMVTVSDNTAFNILLQIAGMDNVNDTLRCYGYKDTVINRKLFDWDKINKGIDNYHSVKEVTDMLHRLYLGQLISSNASSEILEVLKHHQRTNVMPYYFPENMVIAHQSGFDMGMTHDMGIVYADNPFILCMSASNVNTPNAESVMRDVAMICYRQSNS